MIAVNVPSENTEDSPGIGSGKKTVSVTATGSGRVAEGSIEIPKAVITLDPVTSRRGTTVNASGSGFPSRDLVQVKLRDRRYICVTVGYRHGRCLRRCRASTFTVPTDARIGSKHNVEATSSWALQGRDCQGYPRYPGRHGDAQQFRTA